MVPGNVFALRPKVAVLNRIYITCGTLLINEWVERKRRKRGEWDKHITRMDAKKLVKLSRSPERSKRRWSDLTPD